MKKVYSTPEVEIVKLNTLAIIAASSLVYDPDREDDPNELVPDLN